MLIPPVCLGCGFPIGDLAEEFRKKKNDMIKSKIGNIKSIYCKFYVSNINIDFTSLFDEMKIFLPCCRAHLSQGCYWTDIINSDE